MTNDEKNNLLEYRVQRLEISDEEFKEKLKEFATKEDIKPLKLFVNTVVLTVLMAVLYAILKLINL